MVNNQLICGDFVKDTPPDPKLGYTNCIYSSGGLDYCGDPYAPLGNNYMAYASMTCGTSFTTGQMRRMKNALQLLPNLYSTQLVDYTYIRGNSIVCFSGDYVINSNNAASLTIDSSPNINVTISSPINNEIALTVYNVDQNISNEGGPAWISAKIGNIEQARMDFWVGRPKKVLPNAILGPIDVYKDDVKEYYLETKLGGAEGYVWQFPGYSQNEEAFPFQNTHFNWQYDYLAKYNSAAQARVGTCSGEILLYGINECGDDDDNLEGLTINVVNTPPNSNCPPPPGPDPLIVYYPNPADSLLEIDMSLQQYKIFDIVIYDEGQTVKYSGQSTNVIKSIDTFNLVNSTYYLHIYDGTELILSKILIINH